jgi:hypothetical protein
MKLRIQFQVNLDWNWWMELLIELWLALGSSLFFSKISKISVPHINATENLVPVQKY